MKYVHAAVAMSPPVGVVRQMEYERAAAVELGIDWSVWLCCRRSRRRAEPFRLLAAANGTLLRIRFYFSLVRLAKNGHRIVLRHSPGDPFLYLASFFLGTYYTVHHTVEEDELAASPDRLAPLQLKIERVLGRRVVARASALVCVTPEIARQQLARLPKRTGRAAVIYPNGVLFDETSDATVDMRETGPEVTFLASHFHDWHGLDRLLDSMQRCAESGVLHLVGVVPESLRRRAESDPRVRIHGSLTPAAIEPLVRRSWIGLSSFNLESKGMTEACTLKVREYLRAGVPVYAGHRDSGLPLDFAYFRQGRADWNAIIAFAREMRPVPRTVVAKAARPWIDKKALLERLYRSLEDPTAVQH